VRSEPTFHVVETNPTPGAPPMRGARPVAYPAFPAEGAAAVVLRPTGDGNGIASLGTAPVATRDTLADNVAMSGSTLASTGQSQHRLLYATPVLRDTLRISGTPRITIRVATNKPAANLSVWLVTLPYDSTRIGSEGNVGVVTRGWADIQNHRSLTKGGDYNSLDRGEQLALGQFYELTFDLEPDHQVIPPGKQLGIMIMSSDRQFTLQPQPGTQLMVDLARTTFTIPIVGGLDALVKAGGFPTVP
jgi:X-Pro dipeptidyl-peptidase